MLSSIDIKYFKMAVPGPYRESQVDIAAKCPICGDSKHKKSVKRLHLYEKSGTTLVNCFNGGCAMNSQKNLYNFLRIFYPNLLHNYRIETFKINIKNYEKPKDDFNFTLSLSDFKTNENVKKENIINNINELKTEIKNKSEPQIQDTKYLSLPKGIWDKPNKSKDFLVSRNLNPNEILNNFIYFDGIDSFNYNGTFYDTKNSIIFPFLKDKKVYGFYSRKMDTKKFVNCSFIKGFGIWNLFNVDLTKRVFIFEGILDALSYYQMFSEKNIIALNTANISKEALGMIEKPVFCLDNDSTGINNMLKYNRYNNNFEFLIYPEDFKLKDFNEILKNNYNFKPRFEKGFKALIELKKLL